MYNIAAGEFLWDICRVGEDISSVSQVVEDAAETEVESICLHGNRLFHLDGIQSFWKLELLDCSAN